MDDSSRQDEQLMEHFRRLGNRISKSIPPDENSFTGRECPQPDCEGYFKIEFGTGLEGGGLPCHCPYCGHAAGQDQFYTKAQLEYAKSVGLRKITAAIQKDLKKLEFDHKPKGPFGIGLSMKVTPGPQPPIRYYRETQLETEVLCTHCTLRYSVYGVFAFCPDCGQHNSIQILEKNLAMVGKMLKMVTREDNNLAEKFIENALEDCVSSFDGFGRELCRVHANKARSPEKAEKMNFQNLENARQGFLDLFGIDLSAAVELEEWTMATIAFQKRHLIAHKLSVVDQGYITKTGDTRAVVGRKIVIDAGEVQGLAEVVNTLALHMAAVLQKADEETRFAGKENGITDHQPIDLVS